MYFNGSNKIPKAKCKRNRRPLQATARGREAIIGLGWIRRVTLLCTLLETRFGGCFYKSIKSFSA